jgi:hypothetical protein
MALSEHKSSTVVYKKGLPRSDGQPLLNSTWGVDGPSQSRLGFAKLGQ